jgi:hypothetical protein
MSLPAGIRAIAGALLLAVAVSQLWNVLGLSRSPPTMVSHFVFNPGKCALRASPDIAPQSLSVEGRNIQLWVQSADASETMFKAQGTALRRALDCGTSPWCEGKGADDTYGTDQLPLVQRKRRGEAVELRGCEITADDFSPVSFKVLQPASRRLDALAAIALIVNLIALAMVLRPARK